MYKYLYILFVVFFLAELLFRRKVKWLHHVMAALLLLLVMLRASSVGPDTEDYIHFYLFGFLEDDNRAMETGFVQLNHLVHALGAGPQVYLAICALLSVGFVIYSIEKKSTDRVISLALFLFCFGWYFFLTGIRQALAIGFFSMGVLLLDDLFEVQSLRDLKVLLKGRTLLGILCVLISPTMHNTAILAIVVLLVVLIFRFSRNFFLILIPATFVIAIVGAFGRADIVLDSAFDMVENQVETASRYAGYLTSDDAFMSNLSLYLILKNLLPVNLIAVGGILCAGRRRFTPYEHFFFWMVVLSNLFYFFSYMFRMRMFFYPMACIAIPSLFAGALGKQKAGYKLLLVVYVLVSAYMSYVNLIELPDFEYSFFFIGQ